MFFILSLAGSASAQDVAGQLEAATTTVQQQIEALQSQHDALALTANNIWMLVATALVFIMHLGFASIESGLTQAKNTTNVLFKNVSIVGIGLLTYAFCGFNLMYPGEAYAGGFFGFSGFGIGLPEGYDPVAYAGGGYTYWTDFIFQGMFAATAATIVSGAVAERVKLLPFLIFSTIYVAIIYPMVGMWQWGGGFLAAAGFHDFAGSTIVHSVGGWAALAGVIALGPRLGKYIPIAGGKGTILRPIMGHSMPLAVIGMLLLWFGWFGFNGGSVLSADPDSVSKVFVTTSLAAAAGIFGAMIPSWIIAKKPDLTMILNGALAGLVGITAGADVVSPGESIIIGVIAGVIVVFSVIALDRFRLDDPVGAVSVHLVCGVWGTLATGLWGIDADGNAISFLAQLEGVGATAVLCFPAALAIFYGLRATAGIRVSKEEERGGLDIGEHGMEAYSGFQFFITQ
ncbi:MAG: ammonium transporter [Phycisphaeraceae bacterium]|nr:MAG: ammonium transporter [Phycisphaeraceae bacterium]